MRKGQSSAPNLLLDDGDGPTVAEGRSPVDFGEKAFEIEGLRVHGDLAAVGRARPFILGPVVVELDAVSIGIAEVDGFTDAVVGPADPDARVEHALDCLGQGGAARIADGEVVEARMAGRRRRAAFRLPGVEADVVVVAACGDEGGLISHARLLLEAEYADVEREGAVDVGDLQVDVADVRAWIDRGHAESFATVGLSPRRARVVRRASTSSSVQAHSRSRA